MTSKVSDLKLIIESNELGKKAQLQVIQLNDKVGTLDSLVKLGNIRTANLQSTIATKDSILFLLKAINHNDSTIISHQKDIIAFNEFDIKLLKKEIRRQKTKTFLVGLLGILGTGFVTYLAIRY